MPLGNLGVKVGADIGGYTSNMDTVARIAHDRMGDAAGSVDDFRQSLLQTSADLQKVARSMGSNMDAANDAIVSSSEKSAAAIQKISDTADGAEFKSMGEKIAEAVGAGMGAGIVAAQTAWDRFAEWTKAKAIVTGVVIGAIFTAVGLGAIYAAYRVISGTMGFITGLITGDSYKSESIDALIAANNQVKEIQQSLNLTAQQAAATDAAIKALGVNKADYTSVFTGAANAVRANTQELDRLGVKYKDTAGNLLPLDQVVQNANKALNDYTEGWDRNSAAAAIGMGSAASVAAAASVTSSKIAEAGARLNDYNLGIGTDTQASVARYEAAMLAFNRETDLTAQGFKRAWADQIMPALTDFAEFFKDGFPFAVNVFRYSMATITSLFYGLKTVVYMVAESIVGSVSAIGSVLGGVATAGALVLTGDFIGAKNALVSGWTDAKARLGGIGDNIVAQAQHNANAMRQAWAMDDRNAPGVAAAKTGKTFIPKPEKPKETAFDDVAKRVMEGAIKVEEDLIAEENALLQSREEMLQRFHNNGIMQDAEYFATREQLIKENLKTTLGAYDDQVAAIEEYIKTLDSEIEMSKIVQEQNKIDSIWRKQAAAEAAASKKIINTSLDQSDALAKKDPWAGAAKSIRDYGNAASEVGTQVGSALTNAFKSAEDAFVKFAMTGKLSFTDMAQSIMADIIRIQARQAIAGASSGVGNFIGSLFNTGSSASAGGGGGGSSSFSGPSYSAAGGFDVPAGVNPKTQLHQREMVLPEEQADVIRSLSGTGKGAGGSVGPISVHVDASGSSVEGDGQKANDLGRMIGNAVRSVLVQEMRQGGMLAA